METVASSAIEPSWKQDELFVVDKIFSFIEHDSWPTSRPISIESTNPADIFLMFDRITYDKGASLIRMMSMFLGAEDFQQGIRNYLKELSYTSAKQEDLWRYLSEATNNRIDVERIMTGWTRQAGYPVIEVNRIYSTKSQTLSKKNAQSEAIITQQPFNLFPSVEKKETWWVPFKYFNRTSFEV